MNLILVLEQCGRCADLDALTVSTLLVSQFVPIRKLSMWARSRPIESYQQPADSFWRSFPSESDSRHGAFHANRRGHGRFARHVSCRLHAESLLQSPTARVISRLSLFQSRESTKPHQLSNFLIGSPNNQSSQSRLPIALRSDLVRRDTETYQ